MKRKYQMTVFVEFVDEVKESSAVASGAELRIQEQAVEDATKNAVQASSPRSVTRKNVRVNVTAGNVEESP